MNMMEKQKLKEVELDLIKLNSAHMRRAGLGLTLTHGDFNPQQWLCARIHRNVIPLYLFVYDAPKVLIKHGILCQALAGYQVKGNTLCNRKKKIVWKPAFWSGISFRILICFLSAILKKRPITHSRSMFIALTVTLVSMLKFLGRSFVHRVGCGARFKSGKNNRLYPIRDYLFIYIFTNPTL